MAKVHATLAAAPEEVWEALVDVRTYPDWLIGARKIRSVDDGWPAPGTAFHHTVGLVGPLSLSDRTLSEGAEPNRSLALDVRAWPLVHGKVRFDLRPTPKGTEVTMEEHATGIHRLLGPVMDPLSMARNRTSLEKLERVVRQRSGAE